MLSIEDINNLESENKQLREKLEHIKIVGYASAIEIRKKLKNYFKNNESVTVDEIDTIICNEIEKTDNLCLMCKNIDEITKEWSLRIEAEKESNRLEKAIKEALKYETFDTPNPFRILRQSINLEV